jgi:hypothetical protein
MRFRGSKFANLRQRGTQVCFGHGILGIQLHRFAEMRNGLRELAKRGVAIAEIVGVSGPKSDSGLIVRKRLTGLAAQLKNRAKIVLRGEVGSIARDVVTPERFVDGSRTSHAHAIRTAASASTAADGSPLARWPF